MDFCQRHKIVCQQKRQLIDEVRAKSGWAEMKEVEN
jgi:hypothetical protein